jgi:hypothetical protein
MKSLRTRIRIIGPAVVLALSSLAAVGGAAAPDGGVGRALPPRNADAVLADAIVATGGETPWRAHHSMQIKTEIEYRKMAISATRTQVVTAKNKALSVTTIPSVGVVNEGSNGKVAWSEDPVNGLRILSGAEAEQARLESTWNVDHYVHQLFDKIEVRAMTDGGRPLECLDMTPKLGQVLTTCYDARTHLQVLQKGTAATPQGDVPFSSRTKEWKDYGGMQVPALVEMTTGPIEFTARVTEVLFDRPVDDKMFEVPAQKAKRKGGSAAK